MSGFVIRTGAKKRAWAAGFYEGEGSAGCNRGQLNLSVAQNDTRILLRFQEAMGGKGSIVGPYGAHDMYYFRAHGRDFNFVIRALWPYLGVVKREQIQKAVRQAVEHTKRNKYAGVRLRVSRLAKKVA